MTVVQDTAEREERVEPLPARPATAGAVRFRKRSDPAGLVPKRALLLKAFTPSSPHILPRFLFLTSSRTSRQRPLQRPGSLGRSPLVPYPAQLTD